MNTFNDLQRRVLARFEVLSQQPALYVSNLEEDIFDLYLSAFTDEDRQEHNCNCCRQFLRTAGSVVSVRDGIISTLWDFEIDEPFNKVPEILAKAVREGKIARKFLVSESRIGTEVNRKLLPDNSVRTYNHFFLDAPRFTTSNSLDSDNGTFTTSKETTFRSLKELSLDSVNAVLELIAQNSIYRGSEFKHTLNKFMLAKVATKDFTDHELELYAIENHYIGLNIRNTAIGSLLVDLSEGRDLDSAVTSYENKVAPMNYKRPTALVSPRMIDEAKKTLENLGLLPSLSRRHAEPLDLPINKILFADRKTNKLEPKDLFATLKNEVIVDIKSYSKVEEVPYKTFIEDILPMTSSVDVLMESRLENNLMNLLSAANGDAELLFAWDNPVSWSYNNNVTDSVKERIKAAGGTVEGFLRCSLSWYNHDDLDLYVIEPDNNRIYFNKKVSRSGGFLDVDMNAGRGESREPVENILFKLPTNTSKGVYKLIVNNYCRRDVMDVGFHAEIECNGELYNFDYPPSVPDSAFIEVAYFTIDPFTGIVDMQNKLPVTKGSVRSREIWGINTNTFVPVDLLLFSPNHWEGNETGNQHLFFMLPEARNPNDSRGVYNEFLRPSLNPHRKVMELLGDRSKVPAEGRQMAGLGFSLTNRNYLYCRVAGSTSRVIKLIF